MVTELNQETSIFSQVIPGMQQPIKLEIMVTEAPVDVYTLVVIGSMRKK